MLLEKSAFLEFCPHCGLHAHIRFSDNSTSEEFIDRTSGREVIQQAHQEKKLDEFETAILIEQLENSNLSQKDGVQQKLMQLVKELQKIKKVLDGDAGSDSDIPRCQDFILN